MLGQPALPKAGKGPWEESDPEMLAQVLRMVFDDDYNVPLTEDYIMDNMGPDPDTGAPRLSPKDVKTLIPFARIHEKSPAYTRAVKELEQAFKDGILDNSQYTAIMQEFMREVDLPNTGVMGDTFHMNIDEASIPDAFRLAGKHLNHVHLADSNRAAPGKGHLDFVPIMQALKDIQYSGHLTFELLPAAADPFGTLKKGGGREFFDEYTEQSITYMKGIEKKLT